MVNDQVHSVSPKPKTVDILKRGLFRRCPACGEGKMLRGYTTPLHSCSHCHQDFDSLRADDGPAWATILIAGHLTMPFVFWILELGLDNIWIEIGFSTFVILAICAFLLPLAKGVFMAAIWMTSQRKENS